MVRDYLISSFLHFRGDGGFGDGRYLCNELGVITAIEVVALPPLSRFNSPKDDVSTNQNSAFPF
jgi:hypothetical protein